MVHSHTAIPTETWVQVNWEDYQQLIALPEYAQASGYYHHGCMRLEMSPLSNPHSRDHFIVLAAIALYASIQEIDLDGHDNCTYRKTGQAEAQPDASFYLGEQAEVVPWEATIIDLDVYPAPDLVIEIAFSSLSDDKGEKRLLYEELGVREFWIVDVHNARILAFETLAGAELGSRRITASGVLPGLSIALLEEALRRSREMNHGRVSAWLLQTWQR
jgi:Uma2 family endonuclease